jgi:hypothetical protein
MNRVLPAFSVVILARVSRAEETDSRPAGFAGSDSMPFQSFVQLNVGNQSGVQ